MSEDSWRRKRYYNPRVVIGTSDVLDCPFPDSLVCLTGAELALLRNMTQYLHRRSTFASAYHEGYYLAPTNEEWDTLDAIVAELEDKLMGCPEITTMLEDILAAAECVCEGMKTLQAGEWPSGGSVDGQPDYDDYQSPVIEDEGDPPEGWETWDDWRVQKCISAQKLIDDVIDRLGDMNAAVGAGIVLNFAAVMAMMIVGAFVPPIVIVLAIAALLAQLGISALTTEGTLWLSDAKQDIVCAIFTADSILDARTAVMEYIDDNWDVEGSPAVIKYMLNWWALSHIFDGNMPGYDDWKGEYSASYCEDCTEPPIEGDGWFAVWLDPEAYTYTMQRPGGEYPQFVNWTIPKRTDRAVLGMFWTVTVETGDATFEKKTHETAPSTSRLWTDGVPKGCQHPGCWCADIVDGYIDEVACIAAVHPGAILVQAGVYRAYYADYFSGKCNLGNYTIPGILTWEARYIVYEGEP